MSDEASQQSQDQSQPQPRPSANPQSQPGGLSEAEIQEAIANSTDWIQKGEHKHGIERR